MKKIIPSIQTLLVFVFFSLFQTKSFSQVSVVSTTGYAVNIDVSPIAVIPSTNNCAWGYVYTVKMRYNITITGRNKPSSLYTLQGTVGCGSSASYFDLPNDGGSGTVNSASAWSSATNCGSVTVASLDCKEVNIQISGPGINYRSVSFTPTTTTLPVRLVNFAAEQKAARVKLNWATASELNNDYFTIERSADGTNWNSVKKVKGTGNSNSMISYEAYDDAPLAGNSYYRLKQTDLDGKSTYSEVQAIRFTPSVNGITLYPVPNTGNTVNISGITDYQNHDITVLNAGGSVMYTATLNKSSIDLPALQPGLYIIRLKNKLSGEIQSLRYVKI